jgi:hypothetical protein
VIKFDKIALLLLTKVFLKWHCPCLSSRLLVAYCVSLIGFVIIFEVMFMFIISTVKDLHLIQLL